MRYEIGDTISFKFNNEIKTGIIKMIDTYKDDISYDIFVTKENILYKHITSEVE